MSRVLVLARAIERNPRKESSMTIWWSRGTEEQARALAKSTRGYIAKRCRDESGEWFVWCVKSAHYVEFGLNDATAKRLGITVESR
jgi:hypothetical protein